MQGIDMSFDRLTPAEAQRLVAAGYEVFMQCLWTGREQPLPRVENLRVAQQAGFKHLCGYISVTGSKEGAWHYAQGHSGVPNDLWAALKYVPVDVELPDIPNQTIRDAVEAGAVLGKRRCIYTSYGQWTGHQGNSTAFTDCLLFNASWDNDPDVDFERLPFGGWTAAQVLAEQYTGGGNVEGAFADQDTFNDEFFKGDIVTTYNGKYTDAQLDGIFGSILVTLGKALGMADTAGKAIINHVATHPNGGPSQTMQAELDVLRGALTENAKDLEDFKSAIAAAAGNDQG